MQFTLCIKCNDWVLSCAASIYVSGLKGYKVCPDRASAVVVCNVGSQRLFVRTRYMAEMAFNHLPYWIQIFIIRFISGIPSQIGK